MSQTVSPWDCISDSLLLVEWTVFLEKQLELEVKLQAIMNRHITIVRIAFGVY